MLFFLLTGYLFSLSYGQLSPIYVDPYADSNRNANQNTNQNQNQNKNSADAAAKKLGSVQYENYVDSEGNKKDRAYRYGFQYKEDASKTKADGKIQRETYVDDKGEKGSKNYRWKFQYTGEDQGQNTSSAKVKAPKFAPPTKDSDAVLPTQPQGTKEPAGSVSGAAASAAASAPTFAPSEDTKAKQQDFNKKILDLIKERQKLTEGASENK